MEGKPHFLDGSEECVGLWIIPLQDSVEMLSALWNAVLDSPHSPVQSVLQQKVFKFCESKLYHSAPPCFVGRVDPSNGTEFWRKVTPHIQELSDEGSCKLWGLPCWVFSSDQTRRQP